MARIYRHTYTIFDEATGKRVLRRTAKWYIEFRDEKGQRRRVPGFTDKIATQRKAAEIEHGVVLLLRGEKPQPSAPTQTKTVEELLPQFAAFLRAKGDTERHITIVTAEINKLVTGIYQNLQVPLSSMTRTSVEQWLAQQRNTGKFGASTTNHYTRAGKSFTRWAMHEGLLQADPLAGLRLIHEGSDRKRTRRALSTDELSRLIAAARKSTHVRQTYEPASMNRGAINGVDRAMLYQLAAFTGLRRSELLTLTPQSFRLDDKPSTVTIESRHAKNRKSATLPIPDWLATELRTWLAGRRGPLWSAAKWIRTAEMLRVDLQTAKIPYRDSRGRVVDFHSLRMTFITGLALAGVPLVVAQKAARHSSPILTANVYSSIDLSELAKAVDKLGQPQVESRGKKRKAGK